MYYIHIYVYVCIYIYVYIYIWVSNSWYLAVHARIAGIRCSSSLQMMVSEVSRPTKFFVGEDPMWFLMVLTRCQQRLKPHSPTALIIVGYSWVDSHRQVTSQCADPFFWFSPVKMLAGCCTNGKVTTFPPGRSIMDFFWCEDPVKILWQANQYFGLHPGDVIFFDQPAWEHSEWCLKWMAGPSDSEELQDSDAVWYHHSILFHSNFIISIIPGS